MKIKILGGIIGGALGYITGVISAIRAKAVITVHPELAIVSWKTAFLSGHYREWIFYHNPNDAITAACLLGVLGRGACCMDAGGDGGE